MSPRMDAAMERWGEVPDWLTAMIAACDAKGSSQNKVAKTLGLSQSVISQVLRREYQGNMANVEKRVRAVFMPGEITCPALGVIGTADCLHWQDRADALNSATPHVVRMYRACRTCPRYQDEEDAA